MLNRLLLIGALALPLSACTKEADTVVEAPVVTEPVAPSTMDPMATTDPMAPADPMAGDVTVDGTNAAIGTDITALPAAAALSNIDGWIAKLEGDQFAPVRANLETLKLDLAAQPMDGAKIGATLSMLGEQTTAAAATASSSSQAGLQQLGASLSAAGAKLGAPAM